MNGDLEIWKRKSIKKGRVRSALLESGPVPLNILIAIARRDDPHATEESLETILLNAPHKFFFLPDGRWGAYPDEEVRMVYSSPYKGPFKKRTKKTERGPLESYLTPPPPGDGRFGLDNDGTPAIILMGDELMMTGTPRLLLEFKAMDKKIMDAIYAAFEEETPFRFFVNEKNGHIFIGTRNILDIVEIRSSGLRVVASPAADDSRKALVPNHEQRILIQEHLEPSKLPVPLDGSIILPFTKVPALPESEHRSFSIPATPIKSDDRSLRHEFMKIRTMLKDDPKAWSEVRPFLERKKPLVDARSWEMLLLMALNAPNANCLDLIEVLNLHLCDDPDPGFALEIVRGLSRAADPEGKIAVLIEDFATIATQAISIDRTGCIAIARAFYRGDDRYDEAAQFYLRAMDDDGGLGLEDLCDAATSFRYAYDLPRHDCERFLAYFESALFTDKAALPDAPDSGFIVALNDYSEFVAKYRPGKLLEIMEKVLGYLTAVQVDDYAKQYFCTYRCSVRRFADRLNLLSSFETCESRKTLEWVIERLCDDFEAKSSDLTPMLISATAERLEVVERLAGWDSAYSTGIWNRLETKIRPINKANVPEIPILKKLGISSVAIVGGNDIYRERMKGELCLLGAERVVGIPPSFEQHLDQVTLHEKLRSVDLVLHVTTYTKHAEHNMIQNIKNTPGFSFRLVRVNGGPSRSLHELKAALAS
jgi:hypothetical protein